MIGKTLFSIFLIANFPIFVLSSLNCSIKNNNQMKDGIYGDPNNCGRYFQCIDGKTYEGSCPPGHRFEIKFKNEEISICTNDSSAKCLKNIFNSSSTLNIHHTIQNVMECSHKKTGLYPSVSNCDVYYHCFNGMSFEQKCPDGYFFTPLMNKKKNSGRICVPASEAICSITGSWSAWSKWSACEIKTGNSDGFKSRRRICFNPKNTLNTSYNCIGSSVDTQPCTSSINIDRDVPAFMVSLESVGKLPTRERFTWDKIDFNYGQLYDPIAKRLNITRAGLHFFSITLTVKQYETCEFHLPLQDMKLLKSSTKGTLNMVNRLGIRTLLSTSDSFIEQIEESARALGSLQGKETSWSGFFYDTSEYFFASRSRNWGSIGSIQFDSPRALSGFSYGPDFKFYEPLNSGLFFLHFGLKPVENTRYEVQLVINNEKINGTKFSKKAMQF